MRFRTGVVVGGILGYLLARKLGERDPDDARPPGIRQAMTRHPSTTRLADSGRRLAERATWKGAEAVQRARTNLQRRIDGNGDEAHLN